MAKKKKYQIVGCVVSSWRGVPNVRVEAWDKDLLVDDLVSDAMTGADGRFQMQFDTSYFSELFLDRQPDLFLKSFMEINSSRVQRIRFCGISRLEKPRL